VARTQDGNWDNTVEEWSGTTVLSWSHASDALAISGSVYWDGNRTGGGSQPLNYTGQGTIYVTGTGLTHLGSAAGRDAMHKKLKDAETLTSLPKERLFSATSESLNWVGVGGAMEQEPLKFELVDYVPVYRTPANTGGGWAFGRWK